MIYETRSNLPAGELGSLWSRAKKIGKGALKVAAKPVDLGFKVVRGAVKGQLADSPLGAVLPKKWQNRIVDVTMFAARIAAFVVSPATLIAFASRHPKDALKLGVGSALNAVTLMTGGAVPGTGKYGMKLWQQGFTSFAQDAAEQEGLPRAVANVVATAAGMAASGFTGDAQKMLTEAKVPDDVQTKILNAGDQLVRKNLEKTAKKALKKDVQGLTADLRTSGVPKGQATRHAQEMVKHSAKLQEAADTPFWFGRQRLKLPRFTLGSTVPTWLVVGGFVVVLATAAIVWGPDLPKLLGAGRVRRRGR